MSKICTQCKIKKDETMFYKTQHGKFLMSECKKCYRQRVKLHNQIPKIRKKNLERLKARYLLKKKYYDSLTRKWEQNHKEYCSLRSSCYQYRKKLKELGINIEFEKFLYDSCTIKLLKKRFDQVKKLYKEAIRKQKCQI